MGGTNTAEAQRRRAADHAAARREAEWREAREYAAGIDPVYGGWVAGLIDGEGSLMVRPQGGERRDYVIAMSLGLRGDDRPVLEEIFQTLGIGRVHRGGREIVRWSVASRHDVMRLVALLERFPLRTRKARDFEIWRRAAYVRFAMRRQRTGFPGRSVPNDWSELRALRAELLAVREYHPH